jgi:hypothetical protein
MSGQEQVGVERPPAADDRLFGRGGYESAYYRHFFIAPATAASSNEADPSLYVWIDPSRWVVAPPLYGKRVALVANTPVRGHGAAIDSFDDVIRMNRMEYWQKSAEDDGKRVTIWAGVPRHLAILGNPHADDAAATGTNFPEVASGLALVWAATPFHLSLRFYNFLVQRGLLDRLVVSGSGPFLHEYLSQRLPPAMVQALYTIPPFHTDDGFYLNQTHFELMLTGVRLTLFCLLAGTREIGLFGFNFYEGTTKRPWGLHSVRFERELLDALIATAPRFGSKIVRFGA